MKKSFNYTIGVFAEEQNEIGKESRKQSDEDSAESQTYSERF